MRYSDDIIEEVRMKNDIVDVVSQYVKLNKEEVPILDFVRFIMRKLPLFGNTGEADVLLLRMRSRRECI